MPESPGVTNFKQQQKAVVGKPLPNFPSIPDEIKSRFPDLRPFWDTYEKQVALWVIALQNK